MYTGEYGGVADRVIYNDYDVIQTGRGGRQRDPLAAVAASQNIKTSDGSHRKKQGLKLLTFAAGTISAFGLGSAMKAAGVTSGVARGLLSGALGGVGLLVGKHVPGAPGTFGYGVFAGSMTYAAYEGWTILKAGKDLLSGIPVWADPGLGVTGPSGAFQSTISFWDLLWPYF